MSRSSVNVALWDNINASFFKALNLTPLALHPLTEPHSDHLAPSFDASVSSLLDQLEAQPEFVRKLLQWPSLGHEYKANPLLSLAMTQAELKLQFKMAEDHLQETLNHPNIRDLRQSIYTRLVNLAHTLEKNYLQLADMSQAQQAYEHAERFQLNASEYANRANQLLEAELVFYIPKACQTGIQYERQRLSTVLKNAQKPSAEANAVDRDAKLKAAVNHFFERVEGLYQRQVNAYRQLAETALSESATAPKLTTGTADKLALLSAFSQQRASYETACLKLDATTVLLTQHQQLAMLWQRISEHEQACQMLAGALNVYREAPTFSVLWAQFETLLCQPSAEAQELLSDDLNLILQSLQHEHLALMSIKKRRDHQEPLLEPLAF